jgi:hypothetical protein
LLTVDSWACVVLYSICVCWESGDSVLRTGQSNF